jgi:spermidine synthase
LVYAEKTPFQDLAIYEHDFLGRVLVLDGIVQTTQRDEHIYHEMLVHVPLLGGRFSEKPNQVISVLIIGGGDGGILREVLKHPNVQRATMVEIDAAVIEACSRHLGIQGDYTDPRVQLIIGDGAEYIQSEACRSQPYDLVIVDSPDPVGAGEVLYTPEFYHRIVQCMRPQGVFVRHLGVPFYQEEVFTSGVQRMREVFGQVEIYRAAIPTYIGGDMAFAVATLDGRSCREPRQAFTGKYYNREIHTAAFALPSWGR